jgi:hypothetical protein
VALLEIVIEPESREIVSNLPVAASKVWVEEALALDRYDKPVICLLLPVMSPPKVKALMVRVPEPAWIVPPPVKLILLPEVPNEISPLETERPVATWTPLVTSRPPAKELEPALVDKKRPPVVKLPPAWIALVAVIAEKELEPAPVAKTKPPVVTLPVAWTPLVVFTDPAKMEDQCHRRWHYHR